MKTTDWNAYYERPAAASAYSRRITQKLLVRAIAQYGLLPPGGLTIVELGGANSCFIDRILAEFHPSEYHVIDNNQRGLDALARRFGPGTPVILHNGDVLTMGPDLRVDLAFSVGLIEHFDPAGTARAIEAHFTLLRPGGLAIITFPTPTWLYRATRGLAELLRIWRFPDERALRVGEVLPTIDSAADVLHTQTNWWIILTQMIVVARKRST